MAKVRSAHIARALAYAAPPALALCSLSTLLGWLATGIAWLPPIVITLLGWVVLVFVALIFTYLVWTAIYWWCVIRQYMMLPSASLVMVISYLVAWFAAGVLWFAGLVFFRGY